MTLAVGLTGGIGSGKSLALSHLARLGAKSIDTDEIARAQAKPGGPAFRAIRRAFGTTDRAELAKIVFSNPAKRKKLERITHPLVLKEMKRRIRSKRGVVFAAVPLLFEAGLEKEFDLTITIAAPERLRLARTASRPGGRKAAAARMKAQLTDSQRVRRADVVIENAGSPAEFRRALGNYFRALTLIEKSA